MALNVENICKVRDVLNALSERSPNFNMRVYVGEHTPEQKLPAVQSEFLRAGSLKEGDCKSCACIAGWTASVLLPPETLVNYGLIEGEAQSLLGLDWEQADELFTPAQDTPTDPHWDPFSATPKQAAKVLTHLIKTYEETGEGEVVWDAALWEDQ